MSATFNLTGRATIKHLNVRKEVHGEEKILAVDLKFEFEHMKRDLCEFFDDALVGFLWRGHGDALTVRNVYLSPIQYDVDIVDAVVVVNKKKYTSCTIKKFHLEPHDGGTVTLTCTAALYPESADLSSLGKLVQEMAYVSLEG